LAIKIIRSTPGPTTMDQVLDLVNLYPYGVTARELSEQLNRPISMINLCLKSLVNFQQVCHKFDADNHKWIYYRPSRVEASGCTRI